MHQEASETADLQELGRPLGVPRPDALREEKKSPAGVQLTRHLEDDILQCMAKDRPEVGWFCLVHFWFVIVLIAVMQVSLVSCCG